MVNQNSGGSGGFMPAPINGSKKQIQMNDQGFFKNGDHQKKK